MSRSAISQLTRRFPLFNPEADSAAWHNGVRWENRSWSGARAFIDLDAVEAKVVGDLCIPQDTRRLSKMNLLQNSCSDHDNESE